MIDGKYEYFAFISYKEEDAEWAQWLQHKLEHYKLPTTIRKEKPELPERVSPIYEYKSEAGGGRLKEVLWKGLVGSKFLIVICSPRSGGNKSEWVNNGIRYFIDSGLEENIIPFIVEGKAKADNPDEECFPNALKDDLKGDRELRGININEMGRDAAAVKVVSTMFDVKFDILWQRYEREKEEERRRLKEQNDKLSIAQSRFVAEKACRLVEDGDSYLARLLSLEVLPKNLKDPDRPYVPEAEAALRLAMEKDNTIIDGHLFDFKLVSFSPDGKFIVAATSEEHSHYQAIYTWSVEDGRCVNEWRGEMACIDAFAFLPNDTNYITVQTWFNVKVWDLLKNQPIKTEDISIYSKIICLSNKGEYILSASRERHIISLLNTENWNKENIEKDEFQNILCLAISPDCNYIVCGFYDGYIRILNIRTKEFTCIFKEPNKNGPVKLVAYSPKGNQIASAYHNVICVWDVLENNLKKGYISEQCKCRINHGRSVSFISFHPNEDKLIATSNDNFIRIWDVKTQKCEELNGHHSGVNQAKFSPNENKMVSVSSDKTVRLWDSNIRKDYHETPLANCEWFDLSSFNIKYSCLATTNIDNYSISLWNVNTGICSNTYDNCHSNIIKDIAFSPSGSLLASASFDKTVHIFDIVGNQDYVLGEHEEFVNSICFSHNEEFIASASDDQTVKVWNLKTKESETYISAQPEFMSKVVFSANDKKIIALDTYGILHVWDLTSKEEKMFRITSHFVAETRLYLIPKTSLICLIDKFSQDNSIHVWDIDKGKCVKSLVGHDKEIHSVNFSQDGSLLLSSSSDKTIKLWNVTSGVCLKTFKGHTLDVCNAVFYDKEHIMSVSNDKTIIIWNYPSLQKLIDDTQKRFENRKLTEEERKKYYLE
jgi:WD40 repeat protein